MKRFLLKIALYVFGGNILGSILLTEAWGAASRSSVARHSTALSASVASKQVTIEYCPGCRWNLRAFWMAQELLWTFADAPALEAVSVIPCRDEAGRFRVHCFDSSDVDTPISKVLWDRVEQSGFPDIKVLKQLIRDEIDPQLFLGHSDSEDRRLTSSAPEVSDQLELTESDAAVTTPEYSAAVKILGAVSPHIAITYCTQCHWLLRAAYFAQELQSTFAEEMGSLSLIPSRAPNAGGRFQVHLNTDIILWDRAAEGRFPETKELKQRVRDQLNPNKDLGHSDVAKKKEESNEEGKDATLDDDEAEKARSFFGVA